MRRAETSITDRSLQHCLHSGVDDEVGRGVGHYAVLVAQIEFLEWTGDNHLRHTKFVALRDDKPAEKVRRE